MTISEMITALENALEVYGNQYVEMPTGGIAVAVIPVVDDDTLDVVAVSFE